MMEKLGRSHLPYIRFSFSYSYIGGDTIPSDYTRDDVERMVPTKHEWYGDLLVDIEYEEVEGDILRSFISEFNHRLKTGKFETVFPELNDLTSKFQNLSLMQIQELLKSPIFSSDQKIRLLSIEIPATLTIKVGGFILVALQLYFLIHFLEFHRRTSMGDIALSSPWIMFTSSLLARVTAFLSIIVFPVVTSLLLFLQSLHSYQSSILLVEIFQIVLLATSLIIALLIYSVRSKVFKIIHGHR